MRKLVSIIIFILLLCTFSTSYEITKEGSIIIITPPLIANCEHRGYSVNLEEGVCNFEEGNSCDLFEYFQKECGQEYNKEIECRKENELIFPEFEKCCEGLTLSEEVVIQGFRCVKKESNFFIRLIKKLITIKLAY